MSYTNANIRAECVDKASIALLARKPCVLPNKSKTNYTLPTLSGRVCERLGLKTCSLPEPTRMFDYLVFGGCG